MNHDCDRRRVLVLAYGFPPVGGAGVQRVTKFVKYLPDFGWDATVVTVANPSVPVFDESLLADIPPGTRIVKARTLEPGYALKRLVSAGDENSEQNGAAKNPNDGGDKQDSPTKPSRWRNACTSFARGAVRWAANALLQPDPQILWYHHALEAGLKALGERRHDAIFVTVPPFSALLIGAELSRRTGVPLVFDYRDEWDISNAYWENKRQSAWSRCWQRFQHRRVVRAATAMVATTQNSANALRRIAAESGCNPIITHIYNGFDAADFSSGLIAAADKSVGDSSSISGGAQTRGYRLAYVGTLWNLTSVEPLVRAVQCLGERNPHAASRLELHFAGRRTAAQDVLMRQLETVPCRVICQPYVDHDAALQLMRSADGLCLLLADLPHADRVVPAKLFEYLAAQRPILAIVPRGEVADLLSEAPLSFVHSPRDIAGIAQRLEDEIERQQLGVTLEPGLGNPDRYERRQLTRELADLLNHVAGCPPCECADRHSQSRSVASDFRTSTSDFAECHL